MTNNYALLQDLLPVLQKHGIDIDGVHVTQPRKKLLARREDQAHVQVVVHGRVRGA
jgi:hypothetical protein